MVIADGTTLRLVFEGDSPVVTNKDMGASGANVEFSKSMTGTYTKFFVLNRPDFGKSSNARLLEIF